MTKKNIIKIYTTSNGAELNISAPSTKQIISATNNRAQYFAEQAKKYRDEAKIHRDNAKYYSEQNSDVTFEYINNVKAAIEDQLATKQDLGDYALRDELPVKVSKLENDAEYVVRSELETTAEELKLPPKEGAEGCFLMTNGENESWVGLSSFQLFDTKIIDKTLSYEESKGWALQGTYVYKNAIAGSRYGYPDFYNKCIEERNAASATQVTLSGSTITIYSASNGHQYYDIENKSIIDTFYNSTGAAWYYGIDTANERIFLPRNKYLLINSISATAPVMGNGTSLGLTNGSKNFGITSSSNTAALGESVYGHAIGSSGATAGSVENKSYIGVTKDSTKSGIVTKTSSILNFDSKKYLYFCVGNAINYTGITNVIDQGLEILEQVNIATEEIQTRVKLDGSNANFKIITQTYRNGSSWYRIYSDGWCEQGGITSSSSGTSTTISLLKSYKSANYTIDMLQRTGGGAGTYKNAFNVSSQATNSFTITRAFSESTDFFWRACGYIT